MRNPVQDFLAEVLFDVQDQDAGEVADYIPQLRDADPQRLALALCTTDGHSYAVGECEIEFSIQSISKPFVYALALEQRGFEVVHAAVGVEPSGEAFDELSLDAGAERPTNPMINAGAITVHQLIDGDDATPDQRTETIRAKLSKLAGRELTIDRAVAESEFESAHRNFSLAHMLYSYEMISTDPHEAVRSYTDQCAILVTVADLAAMAATLANGGVQPVTGIRQLSPAVCRTTLAVMASAGMYDGAGRWMSSVGIPAKSGVSGGLIGTMPGQLGIASFSPRLDENGNSVRGVKIFQELSESMGLHLMSSEYFTAPKIRSMREVDDRTVVQLQGMINFTAAEAIMYELSELEPGSDGVVLDISRVSGFTRSGGHLVAEGVRRMRDEGLMVFVEDPEDSLSL